METSKREPEKEDELKQCNECGGLCEKWVSNQKDAHPSWMVDSCIFERCKNLPDLEDTWAGLAKPKMELFTTAGFPIGVKCEPLFTSARVWGARADTDLLTIVVSRGTQVWYGYKTNDTQSENVLVSCT